MQFLKTLFWVLVAVIVALFASRNWADVTLNLPKSREAESEGDRIGVELAARAGFDPNAAVSLWEKMSKLAASQPPKWLSTHPPHQERIAELRTYAAKVMPLYAQSKRSAAVGK